MKRPTLLVIFMTVFVDLVGFGLVLPLLPNYSMSFGATAFEAGLIMASYSFMQFLFAPVWGAWSDRIGRRPVLLVSLGGAAVSYGIFAIGSGMTGQGALVVIVISRAFAGLCGANITVAQAYIADITVPEERSKRMGLIGMAFGLGFIVGPALAVGAQQLFGVSGPGWVASAICGANFLVALFRLPESWRPGALAAPKRARLAQTRETLSTPKVGLLVVLFFLGTLGFTCFESTAGLLIQENFQIDHNASARTSAILFCYCGIISALVQTGPIGRLVKKFREPKLIAGSLILFGLSMAPLPFIKGDAHLTWGTLVRPEGWPWLALLFTAAWLAIGSGLTRPPLFGLLSLLTPAAEQGAVLGVAQSAGSLARVIGPPLAGWFFDRHPSWPYVGVSIIAIAAGLIAWSSLVRDEAAVWAAVKVKS